MNCDRSLIIACSPLLSQRRLDLLIQTIQLMLAQEGLHIVESSLTRTNGAPHIHYCLLFPEDYTDHDFWEFQKVLHETIRDLDPRAELIVLEENIYHGVGYPNA